MLLELRDLPADGGLLNAVGNIPHRLHNPAMARDVIEQLQVVDVHWFKSCLLVTNKIRAGKEQFAERGIYSASQMTNDE